MAVVVGVFVTLGCLLAGYLELEGLGHPRETNPRPLYMAALAFGASAGLVVPTALCLVLLWGSSRVLIVAGAGVALAVGLLVLGVTA